LNQFAGLVQALGGNTGTGGVLGALGITNGLQGLIKGVGDLFPGSGGSSSVPFENYVPPPPGYQAPNVEE
jgi:hypothetical protein